LPGISPFDRIGMMRVVLALRNLVRSRGRLCVSLFGIVFASFLMGVQGSLLYSFTMAASRIIDAVDADLVIVGKGTPTFEYVSVVPERYAFLSLGVEGVLDAGRGIAGWAPIERPNGDRTLTFVVGVENAFRGKLPNVSTLAAEHGISDSALVIDATDARTLQYSDTPRLVQIAQRRGQYVAKTVGFSSFLGTPYIFTDYVDAHRFLRMERTQVSLLLLSVVPGHDPAAVRDLLRLRFPDVDVWTKSEFSTRSRMFWLVQTGAGGALTLAAALGFCIGLVLVAQTIYGITAENIDEYATLKAMGASRRDVRIVVLVQSLVCGLLGGIVGLVLIRPFAALARPVVTWIAVPLWMYGVVAGAVVVLCSFAALIAAQPGVAVDPGRVFRV
jgi:putative ABC transport system permease protein